MRLQATTSRRPDFDRKRSFAATAEPMGVNRRAITALTHIWCRSGVDDQPRSEQIELAAAIHLALHQFEFGDLAFGLTI